MRISEKLTDVKCTMNPGSDTIAEGGGMTGEILLPAYENIPPLIPDFGESTVIHTGEIPLCANPNVVNDYNTTPREPSLH